MCQYAYLRAFLSIRLFHTVHKTFQNYLRTVRGRYVLATKLELRWSSATAIELSQWQVRLRCRCWLFFKSDLPKVEEVLAVHRRPYRDPDPLLRPSNQKVGGVEAVEGDVDRQLQISGGYRRNCNGNGRATRFGLVVSSFIRRAIFFSVGR